MSTVRVTHTLAGLQRDLAGIPKKHLTGMTRLTNESRRSAEKYMQGLAKSRSGPHGRSYWKRIDSTLTGPMSAEIGPRGEVAGNAVGAGWRTGGPNTDTEKTADLIGPRHARYISNHLNGLFW